MMRRRRRTRVVMVTALWLATTSLAGLSHYVVGLHGTMVLGVVVAVVWGALATRLARWCR